MHYFTKFYVFYKRKFSKVTSETQVSFVNEAPGVSYMHTNIVEKGLQEENFSCPKIEV
jgi:hypothetical protein